MSIRAIIWDMEGVVLLNKLGSVPACIARQLNISTERLETVIDMAFMNRVDHGEVTQEDAWNRMLDKLGKPRSDMAELYKFFSEDLYVDQEMLADIRAYHQRFKTALLSNFSDVMRPMLSGPWRVDGAFDETVISCEVKMAKPEAEIYRYTLDKLGAKPQEAIFIDDRSINVDGAQAVGMHAFQFSNRADMNRRIEEIIAQVK
ncbi:MAG: glucose-phosphatase [Chloroflexota bacterium]|nr:glucose-phosphatase [Chloroflexota bacterium]